MLKIFPLQAMSMDDLDLQLEGYSDEDGSESNRSLCELHKQLLCGFLRDESTPRPRPIPAAEIANTKLTQNEVNSFVADKGEVDLIGSIHASQKSDDCNFIHQKSITDKQIQLKLNAEQQQQLNHKMDSGLDSPDQKPVENEEIQQCPSTLWSMEPRIFAMETAMHGKRRYISAHLGRFMDQYWRECDVYNRDYYELIRENSPCRLYFGKC